MLTEKLAQASAESTKHRLYVILTCLALVVTGGLILLNIVLFDKLSRNDDSSGNRAEAPASHDEGTLPIQHGTAVAEPGPVLNSGNERETFKSLLRDFENNLEGAVQAAEFGAWNQAAQQKIMELKQDSISAFSKGDYAEASNLLNIASEKSREELQSRNQAYHAAYTAALEAKEKDDYDTALQHVNEALRLQPQSAEALALRQAIDNLPAIVDLLDDIAVARIENNPEVEIDLINQVVLLDPERTDLKERANTLLRNLREQRFASQIADGIKNTDQQNLADAKINLANATALYPNRPETNILSDRIASLEIELETGRLLDEAEKASVRDQWQQALELFGKAKDLQPANRKAIDGYTLARSIATSGQAVTKFLSAPERLSSSNVADLASLSMDQAAPYAGFSPALKSRISELDALIRLYETKVDVRVISDDMTEISVRGVGRVGKTEKKVIQLKPGTYSFEGKRSGFKSVLLEVEVPPGSSGIDVRVVCHEQV